MTLEKSIEHSIRRMIRDELGGMSIKLHGSPYQEAGLPDLVVILRGRVFWLEVKRPGRKLTRVQSLVHERLRANGAQCYVVYSVEEARAVLAEATGGVCCGCSKGPADHSAITRESI